MIANENPPATGLSNIEATNRLRQFGPNVLAKTGKVSFWKIVLTEVTEPMIMLLLFVGFVYSVWGSLEDGVTIFVIITALVSVEVWNEFRAKKAIDALSKIAVPAVKVWRDGVAAEAPLETVVPGDLLLLGSGTRVAADGRMSVAFGLQVDESALTGESVAVLKQVGEEIFAGTLVVAGEGKAEVTVTGGATKFGKIAAAAQAIKPPRTPLQLAMRKLAGYLAWVAIFFSVTIPLIGFWRGQPLRESILTGLALAFAVIPEEGPIIVTMVLGLGAYQLSKERFLIKKLKAAEVLGDATVILTDKTGTLTESVMRVASVFPAQGETEVITAACGIQTEMSLLADDRAIRQKGDQLGVGAAGAASLGEVVAQRGFGADRKTKAVLRRVGADLRLLVGGAPEEVFALVDGLPAEYSQQVAAETAAGRRVIAFAGKTVGGGDGAPGAPDAAPAPGAAPLPADIATLENNLSIIGLVILEDPPRAGVRQTLETAAKAGVRTIMVTGDHPQTAAYIAQQVGINSSRIVTGQEMAAMSDEQLAQIVREVSVFARSTPQDKYRLLQALHANHEVVAVTGDGINDTLALKGADVGIAMGIKGTDAAKEAADVVLADDNYATIANAIFQGRKFFDNLRKGFQYYLSVKLALVLIFSLAVILNMPFPFAPIQIILLELFMDLAASSAFVAEPLEKSVYDRQPRDPKESLINRAVIVKIFISSLSLFAAVWGSYLYAVSTGLSAAQGRTFAFAAWVIGHVILAFVSRSSSTPVFKLGLFTNPVILIWALMALTFLGLTVSIPSLASLLRLSFMSLPQLGAVFAICLLAVLWQDLWKLIRYRRHPKMSA